MAFAHSRNDQGVRHALVDHLRGVAELTAESAQSLGARDAGYYAGLWHDIGKFHPDWQRYLLDSEAGTASRGQGPDHKAAGASLALDRRVWPIALLIQGHHGGLQAQSLFRAWLTEKLTAAAPSEATALARRMIPNLEPDGPIPLPTHVLNDPLAAELFIRLLYSALVDADSLDTERHDSAARAAERGSDVSIAELWSRFERFHAGLPQASDDGPVAAARAVIYRSCIEAADLSPGLFRLAAPTGGGKTLSAMAFALRHALQHGHRRVIVAVPFISITEQTADVYRQVFADTDDARPVVLEHHSGSHDVAEWDEGDFRRPAIWSRLAAENWDAPIVVTTTVQLFESLFARGRRACRKLHRLAQAVVILDEAQALPPRLLDPILDALRQLCLNYGTTVVVSTATQPAFETIEPFATIAATEIIAESEPIFRSLTRVEYEWRLDPPLSWLDVAAIVHEERQALVVVNTKRDAIALLDALDDPDALHLSTMLCGAHRRQVIAEVKRRLAAGAPCRLVSTQVIEAGVDLDFPVALRALGPLDAVIQTAGRCNREGRLSRGRVIVFRPAEAAPLPRGTYRIGTEITEGLQCQSDRRGVPLDLDAPATAREYFRQLYELQTERGSEIQVARRALDYPTTAEKFRMIQDETELVVVPYEPDGSEHGQVRRAMIELRRGSPRARLLLRQVQPYTVAVRKRDIETYRRQGLIYPVVDELSEWRGGYHPVRGLTVADVEVLVV